MLRRFINIWKTQALPGIAIRPLHSYTAENHEASIIATHKLKIYLPSGATLECHNFATCIRLCFSGNRSWLACSDNANLWKLLTKCFCWVIVMHVDILTPKANKKSFLSHSTNKSSSWYLGFLEIQNIIGFSCIHWILLWCGKRGRVESHRCHSMS